MGALSITAASLPARVARGDDGPNVEQLKKMYGEAVDQLRNAQERKNQLATENEQLKARVAELQKQLEAGNARSAGLERQVEEYARKAFFFHSRYTAWQEFLRHYPQLRLRWKSFLEQNQFETPGVWPGAWPAYWEAYWPAQVEG